MSHFSDITPGYAVAQWLGIRLQMLGVAMVVGVAFIAVLEHHFSTVDPGTLKSMELLATYLVRLATLNYSCPKYMRFTNVNLFGCKLYWLCRKHIEERICLCVVVGECGTPILVCAAEIVAFPWLHGGALCKIPMTS